MVELVQALCLFITKFVDIARKLNPHYISVIMPSRWITGGRGLDEFRDSMLDDKHIQTLYDFFDARVCFSNVEIKGGICYFYGIMLIMQSVKYIPLIMEKQVFFKIPKR